MVTKRKLNFSKKSTKVSKKKFKKNKSKREEKKIRKPKVIIHKEKISTKPKVNEEKLSEDENFDLQEEWKPQPIQTFTKDLEEDRGYIHNFLEQSVSLLGKGLNYSFDQIISFLGQLSSWTKIASPISFAFSTLQSALKTFKDYNGTNLEALFASHDNVVAPLFNLVVGSCMGYLIGAITGQIFWPNWDLANSLYKILTFGFDFSYLGLLNIPGTTRLTSHFFSDSIGNVADYLMLNLKDEKISSFLFRKSIYTILGGVTLMGLIFKFTPRNHLFQFYMLISDYVARENPTLDQFLKEMLTPTNVKLFSNEYISSEESEKIVKSTTELLQRFKDIPFKPTITNQNYFIEDSLTFDNLFPIFFDKAEFGPLLQNVLNIITWSILQSILESIFELMNRVKTNRDLAQMLFIKASKSLKQDLNLIVDHIIELQNLVVNYNPENGQMTKKIIENRNLIAKSSINDYSNLDLLKGRVNVWIETNDKTFLDITEDDIKIHTEVFWVNQTLSLSQLTTYPSFELNTIDLNSKNSPILVSHGIFPKQKTFVENQQKVPSSPKIPDMTDKVKCDVKNDELCLVKPVDDMATDFHYTVEKTDSIMDKIFNIFYTLPISDFFNSLNEGVVSITKFFSKILNKVLSVLGYGPTGLIFATILTSIIFTIVAWGRKLNEEKEKTEKMNIEFLDFLIKMTHENIFLFDVYTKIYVENAELDQDKYETFVKLKEESQSSSFTNNIEQKYLSNYNSLLQLRKNIFQFEVDYPDPNGLVKFKQFSSFKYLIEQQINIINKISADSDLFVVKLFVNSKNDSNIASVTQINEQFSKFNVEMNTLLTGFLNAFDMKFRNDAFPEFNEFSKKILRFFMDFHETIEMVNDKFLKKIMELRINVFDDFLVVQDYYIDCLKTLQEHLNEKQNELELIFFNLLESPNPKKKVIEKDMSSWAKRLFDTHVQFFESSLEFAKSASYDPLREKETHKSIKDSLLDQITNFFMELGKYVETFGELYDIDAESGRQVPLSNELSVTSWTELILNKMDSVITHFLIIISHIRKAIRSLFKRQNYVDYVNGTKKKLINIILEFNQFIQNLQMKNINEYQPIIQKIDEQQSFIKKMFSSIIIDDSITLDLIDVLNDFWLLLKKRTSFLSSIYLIFVEFEKQEEDIKNNKDFQELMLKLKIFDDYLNLPNSIENSLILNFIIVLLSKLKSIVDLSTKFYIMEKEKIDLICSSLDFIMDDLLSNFTGLKSWLEDKKYSIEALIKIDRLFLDKDYDLKIFIDNFEKINDLGEPESIKPLLKKLEKFMVKLNENYESDVKPMFTKLPSMVKRIGFRIPHLCVVISIFNNNYLFLDVDTERYTQKNNLIILFIQFMELIKFDLQNDIEMRINNEIENTDFLTMNRLYEKFIFHWNRLQQIINFIIYHNKVIDNLNFDNFMDYLIAYKIICEQHLNSVERVEDQISLSLPSECKQIGTLYNFNSNESYFDYYTEKELFEIFSEFKNDLINLTQDFDFTKLAEARKFSDLKFFKLTNVEDDGLNIVFNDISENYFRKHGKDLITNFPSFSIKFEKILKKIISSDPSQQFPQPLSLNQRIEKLENVATIIKNFDEEKKNGIELFKNPDVEIVNEEEKSNSSSSTSFLSSSTSSLSSSTSSLFSSTSSSSSASFHSFSSYENYEDFESNNDYEYDDNFEYRYYEEEQDEDFDVEFNDRILADQNNDLIEEFDNLATELKMQMINTNMVIQENQPKSIGCPTFPPPLVIKYKWKLLLDEFVLICKDLTEIIKSYENINVNMIVTQIKSLLENFNSISTLIKVDFYEYTEEVIFTLNAESSDALKIREYLDDLSLFWLDFENEVNKLSSFDPFVIDLEKIKEVSKILLETMKSFYKKLDKCFDNHGVISNDAISIAQTNKKLKFNKKLALSLNKKNKERIDLCVEQVQEYLDFLNELQTGQEIIFTQSMIDSALDGYIVLESQLKSLGLIYLTDNLNIDFSNLKLATQSNLKIIKKHNVDILQLQLKQRSMKEGLQYISEDQQPFFQKALTTIEDDLNQQSNELELVKANTLLDKFDNEGQNTKMQFFSKLQKKFFKVQENFISYEIKTNSRITHLETMMSEDNQIKYEQFNLIVNQLNIDKQDLETEIETLKTSLDLLTDKYLKKLLKIQLENYLMDKPAWENSALDEDIDATSNVEEILAEKLGPMNEIISAQIREIVDTNKEEMFVQIRQYKQKIKEMQKGIELRDELINSFYKTPLSPKKVLKDLQILPHDSPTLSLTSALPIVTKKKEKLQNIGSMLSQQNTNFQKNTKILDDIESTILSAITKNDLQQLQKDVEQNFLIPKDSIVFKQNYEKIFAFVRKFKEKMHQLKEDLYAEEKPLNHIFLLNLSAKIKSQPLSQNYVVFYNQIRKLITNITDILIELRNDRLKEKKEDEEKKLDVKFKLDIVNNIATTLIPFLVHRELESKYNKQ